MEPKYYKDGDYFAYMVLNADDYMQVTNATYCDVGISRNCNNFSVDALLSNPQVVEITEAEFMKIYNEVLEAISL